MGTARQTLVGIRTSDGQVLQRIDLAALVAQKAGESLLCVNDVAAADGKLALLLGVRSTADTYPVGAKGTSNGIIYQDLCVLQTVPESAAVAVLASAGLLLHRGRREPSHD